MLSALASLRSRAFSRSLSPIIGIDLGTTNSCVSIFEGGSPKVISNSTGGRTTPSVVAFTKDGKRLVGDQAKRQAVTNPQSTFYATKRLIGRPFEDPVVSQFKSMVPFSIVDKEGAAWVKDGRGEVFSPSQIAAFVLMKMKQTAEQYLGTCVTDAVVTVPAYFNDSQRQATKDAGRIAGLKVQRIVNEPTAAALAYGIERKQGQTIAVFDLGGGTFDISILEISSDGIFEVKATNGDTFLGGEDFDNVLVAHILEEFKKSSGVDLRGDTMAMQRVKEAAEKAKCELSGVRETEVNLPYIASTAAGVKHLAMGVTREKYEELARSLFDKTIAPCQNCLRDAKLKPSDINEVIMVGGMTRTPAVLKKVREFFNKEPYTGVNPDEVVAMGAAIQGSVLKGIMSQVTLLDVTPLSLGIETMGGVFARLIPRNTVVPCRRTEQFSTGVDGQTKVNIRVFQGERELVSGNKLLGDFTLEGIPPLPRGVPKINVSFEIDANSIVHVSAEDEATGKEQKITIKQHGGLSQDEIARMIADAQAHAKDDEKLRALLERKQDYENYIINARKQIDEFRHLLTEELINDINKELSTLEEQMKGDDERTMNNTFLRAKKLTEQMQKIIHDAVTK